MEYGPPHSLSLSLLFHICDKRREVKSYCRAVTKNPVLFLFFRLAKATNTDSQRINLSNRYHRCQKVWECPGVIGQRGERKYEQKIPSNSQKRDKAFLLSLVFPYPYTIRSDWGRESFLAELRGPLFYHFRSFHVTL